MLTASSKLQWDQWVYDALNDFQCGNTGIADTKARLDGLRDAIIHDQTRWLIKHEITWVVAWIFALALGAWLW